jgi:hypothetical protein
MLYNFSMGILENLESAADFSSCFPHIVSKTDSNACINCDTKRGICPECGSPAHGNWREQK